MADYAALATAHRAAVARATNAGQDLTIARHNLNVASQGGRATSARITELAADVEAAEIVYRAACREADQANAAATAANPNAERRR